MVYTGYHLILTTKCVTYIQLSSGIRWDFWGSGNLNNLPNVTQLLKQSSCWLYPFSHHATPPPFLIGPQRISEGWFVAWHPRLSAEKRVLVKSNIYTIQKISVLEWQLAVDKVWHFQINFYRFLSPEKKDTSLMDKASTPCAWEWRGKWAMSCSVEDGGEDRSSCLLSARKPSLGRVQLRGVPTQCQINNANSIRWCFLLTTWWERGAEAVVCARAQPWGDEYLCGQHIKFQFNKYYFEGFNKLILALSTSLVNACKRWMDGVFCTSWWVRKPLKLKCASAFVPLVHTWLCILVLSTRMPSIVLFSTECSGPRGVVCLVRVTARTWDGGGHPDMGELRSGWGDV